MSGAAVAEVQGFKTLAIKHFTADSRKMLSLYFRLQC